MAKSHGHLNYHWTVVGKFNNLNYNFNSLSVNFGIRAMVERWKLLKKKNVIYPNLVLKIGVDIEKKNEVVKKG